MSLRSFHILFMLTVVAALVAMGWMLGNSEAVVEAQRPFYSGICYGLALVLAPYLVWFFWKTRHLEDSHQGENSASRKPSDRPKS